MYSCAKLRSYCLEKHSNTQTAMPQHPLVNRWIFIAVIRLHLGTLWLKQGGSREKLRATQPLQTLTSVLNQMSAVLEAQYECFTMAPSSHTEVAWQHPGSHSRLVGISLLQHHSSLCLSSRGVQSHVLKANRIFSSSSGLKTVCMGNEESVHPKPKIRNSSTGLYSILYSPISLSQAGIQLFFSQRGTYGRKTATYIGRPVQYLMQTFSF